MASDLEQPLAVYPMVHEGEAAGRVAGVYAQMLESMPQVPSLFKSFAVCPPYLVLAWAQSKPALQDDDFLAAATDLLGSAASLARPPDDEDARAVLGAFCGPLSRMLLLAAGLLEALQGRAVGPTAAYEEPPNAAVSPAEPSPTQWGADATTLYGELRRALDTPIINSIWRELAGRGLLEEAWQALGPQVEATRGAAGELQRAAVTAARELRWAALADADAMATAGMADAVPAMTAILDAYVKTLPRVLALAGSSSA